MVSSRRAAIIDSFNIWHLLIALAVLLVLFAGRAQISNVMGEFARGIDVFKEALKDNKDDSAPRPPRRGLSPGLLLMAIVALAITIAAAVKNMK